MSQEEKAEHGDTNESDTANDSNSRRQAPTFAWGKTQEPTGSTRTAAPRLADIMAEAAQEKEITQAALGPRSDVASSVQDQERLLQSYDFTNSNDLPSDVDQDELLQMVMRQSLEEYNATRQQADEESNSVSMNNLSFAPPVSFAPPINEGSASTLEISERQERLLPLRSESNHLGTSSLHESTLLAASNHSTSSVDHLNRSEPTLRTTSVARAARPSLIERDFSQRTLLEIERTEAVVDNPHADLAEKRRRHFSSRASPVPTSKPLATTPRFVPNPPLDSPSPDQRRARTDMMLQARNHLSAREIFEIEQALRTADEEEPSSNHPNIMNSLPSPRPPLITTPRGRPRPRVELPMTSPRDNLSRRAISSPDLARSPSNPDFARHGGPPPRSPYSSPNSSGRKPQLPLDSPNPAVAATAAAPRSDFISEDEAAAIEAAVREADAKAEQESLMLALMIQEEEISQLQSNNRNAAAGRQQQGNVRTMTRQEFQREAGVSRPSSMVGAIPSNAPVRLHPLEQQERAMATTRTRPSAPGVYAESRPPARHPMEEEDFEPAPAGFRMNAPSSQQWSRLDRNTIVGPNNEMRTKHDVEVQGQANADYLGLDEDDMGVRAHVGNQAFNSFQRSMKRTNKGVASHGTGRAGTDSEAIKGKALDPNARLQISRAINAGLIDKCDGAVKQGKEAIIYHADEGDASQGFDVAVKIFKRITEFRGRADYVDGDPRYPGKMFRKASEREQLNMWAEKEYRNLMRANKAGVPVPTPLHYKDNIIFMRFLGNDRWPAPQIRELGIRKGSGKWDILYTQVMEAVRRLFVEGRLVHGDLSEYNILVAPTFQVDNKISSVEDTVNDLQAVLIDFGQAVDIQHPEAMHWLRRDLERVRAFFTRTGVKTLTQADSMEFVTGSNNAEDGEDVEEFHETEATAADFQDAAIDRVEDNAPPPTSDTTVES
eukprot:Nitzschia sp. Nitz4//scaffold30_size153850//41876//44817//NITZ4_002768-RA/size153850-augustus-gene-0.51-mRNA-1//1//CDS//3329547232//1732//frame0